MKKIEQVQKEQNRLEQIKQEKERLTELFSEVNEKKRNLAAGLIEQAAFLYVDNKALEKAMAGTGTVKIHPEDPTLQKVTEAGKQYLKNANTYAVTIKTLNGILSKDALEEDDGFDEFEDEFNN